jgi:uncharacterized repeat protein (TIGR01451 family)
MARSAVAAGGEDSVTATLHAYRVEPAPGGTERLIPALEARVGEIVEYRAEYRNRGHTELINLEVAVPLPPGMIFVPGTAQPVNVLASEDGVAFGPVPLMRTVTDGRGRERLQRVPLADYRFLLWRIPRIGAESSVLLSLRMRVTRPPAKTK